MADEPSTHLVVVGSSAGGIGALSGMVSPLPEDFDAPIVHKWFVSTFKIEILDAGTTPGCPNVYQNYLIRESFDEIVKV